MDAFSTSFSLPSFAERLRPSPLLQPTKDTESSMQDKVKVILFFS